MERRRPACSMRHGAYSRGMSVLAVGFFLACAGATTASASVAGGPVTTEEAEEPVLSRWRQRAGWRSIFDGRSLAGWHACGTTRAPSAGWSVEDGVLVHSSGGGDLVFAEQLANFELELEWSVEPGGNSGVKYRAAAGESLLGPEYQLLDDEAAQQLPAKHRAGALYDVAASEGAAPAAPDVFHAARIVVSGDSIEHWLDGRRVVRIERGSERWADALAQSKFATLADFAAPRPGSLGLQDHGSAARFRNLFLRDLDRLPGAPVEIFDGESLDGWRVLGDAIYEVDDGTILGRIGGGGQSFLITERTFADFILEVDVKTELPGNSGIQVRSRVGEGGRLIGYQIEIDSSERAWSGGLYDEGRRGWLDDLSDDAYARTAFRPGEWNRYRIECVGPTIRAWVNGIPTADHVDHEDAEGVIGLQVHSGNNTRVRWRDFRLRDLGRAD